MCLSSGTRGGVVEHDAPLGTLLVCICAPNIQTTFMAWCLERCPVLICGCLVVLYMPA